MLCEFQGRAFDTEIMAAFSTGVTWMPTVYVSADHTSFVERTRKGWDTPRFRCVPRREALRMADSYHIVGLRELLLSPQVVEPVNHMVVGLTKYIGELKETYAACRGDSLAPDIKRTMDAMEAICQEETEKASRPARKPVRRPLTPPEAQAVLAAVVSILAACR